jgi:hypothetical protein
VYVSQIAKQLPASGYEVDVFTRRDDPDVPDIVPWEDGVRIIHEPAGPATFVPKEALLPYMANFTRFLVDHCRSHPYDAMHANFWMSGLVAADVKKALGIPFVITFHALGRIRRIKGITISFPTTGLRLRTGLWPKRTALLPNALKKKKT